MRNKTLYVAGVVVGLFLLGCSSTGSTVGHDAADDARQDVMQQDDAAGDTSLVQPEVATKDEFVFDLGHDAADDAFAPCQAGEGCFLDPCSENTDCLSGWCVEHMGEGVCTQLCQEECPPGWSCQQAGAGPDVAYICVSNVANLCKPCVTTEGCKAPGGAEDVCVDYGDEGSFCGGACAADDDCPWGFSCVDTLTVDGIETAQCVADAGICPCTQKAVSLSLWTPCEVANEFGTCAGKRYCTEAGLSGCDAGSPVVETCNGLDDDCDGEADEPILVDGKYEELCDDGNPCTDDICAGEEGCQHTSLTEGECVDVDACTIGDHCDAGICVGLPIQCDDGNPCTDDLCDGLGGCTSTFNQADCDDQDPCTVADQCSGGECAGYAVSCDCVVDEDCSALDDDDLCSGTLYCNHDVVPYRCDLVPDSAVECDPPSGPNAACLASVCTSESGECELVAANEGMACSDGSACTVGDTCVSGTCVAGVAAICKDDNVCTDDSCDSETGCVFEPNQDPCSDGNACTVGDSCADGLCVGGALKTCNDGNICTDDACVPDTGCVHLPNDGACDDGNACTTGDKCDDGMCVSVGLLDCDDDNVCTKDQCLPVVGCQHNAIAGPCSDGDACTVGDTCINASCQGGAPMSCDDKNPCTDDSCAEGICQHEFNAGPCDDGNACTVGDTCSDGLCQYGGLVDCDDDNVCTNDSCDPVSGCIHLLNSAPCNDGNVCTTNDQCQLGDCVGTGALSCDDGNGCTDDACDPVVGCTFVANTSACSDGSVCTVNDQCAGGACVPGPALDCDDEDICTDDACDPDAGCLHVNNTAACDDGDACTGGDKCAGGTCQPGAPVGCDDGNVCTDDSCDPQTGCVNTNNTATCDDGKGCTIEDACADGACTGTTCADAGLICWQNECVDHYCGDGTCDGDESYDSCAADCPLTLWLESTEVEWYPVKYPLADWTQADGVATCKAAGLRLWRDELGSADSTDWVYDVLNTHNLGGHDIGYKVEAACNYNQEGHTGTWAIFGAEWASSIKQVTGAGNGANVYILNKQHHNVDYPITASYTIVQPQTGAVTYQGAYPANEAHGMVYAIVLCAKRK